MKTLFFAGVLFFSIACGSGESSSTPANSESNTPDKGNSGGSDIIGMDTMHMDTGSQEPTDSRQ